MSHIFDALQRSAAEQGDIEVPSAALATELFEATERKAAAARAKTAFPDSGVPVAEFDMMAAMRNAVDSAAAEVGGGSSALGESPTLIPTTNQFSQFQSLRVLVPPQSRIVCITEKDSLAAEKFRYLGVRLRHLQQSRQLKKVLITSTIPQEGKSMVAANLACALARQTQHKTLLIDGDLRRPTIASLFGLGKISGISDWLQGACDASKSIYLLEEARLWVLPAGNIPRNPLELMQASRLSLLMEQLTSWFDWIVIDSPPVLPLADASVWMRFADGILLVTRQGQTEKDRLKRGLEAIDQKKLLGTVLNSATTTASNYHYGRYSPVAAGSSDSEPLP
jgi:capsular exopolysaccharide synthesis family protein